jgi:hypothetical protein
MPVQATVILDSGCFLPGNEKNLTTEIGYFQSGNVAQDIRIIADGEELPSGNLMSLGQKCQIEIRHVKADGTIYDEGAKASTNFHKQLLHLNELYGDKNVPVVDPTKFDCILRFDSGHFCGAMLKPRAFKQYRRETDGKYVYEPNVEPKPIDRPIAHNVHVHFKLDEGEAIELARDGVIFWSSNDNKVGERLEIEIIADNSTAEKFYCDVMESSRDCYWVPNQGDPPPTCPLPPCRPPINR